MLSKCLLSEKTSDRCPQASLALATVPNDYHDYAVGTNEIVYAVFAIYDTTHLASPFPLFDSHAENAGCGLATWQTQQILRTTISETMRLKWVSI